MAARGRLTLADVARYVHSVPVLPEGEAQGVQEDEDEIFDAPMPPTGPGPEVPWGQPPQTPPPVPGIDDSLAEFLALGEWPEDYLSALDSQTAATRLRAFLGRDPTTEEATRVEEVLRPTIARGRAVSRMFPSFPVGSQRAYDPHYGLQEVLRELTNTTPEVSAGPPSTPAPVPGVNDYNAWATFMTDEGPSLLMPSAEEMPDLLNVVLNREPTGEEVQSWQENLPAIMARGRNLERMFPTIALADNQVERANPDLAVSLLRWREEAQRTPYHQKQPNPPYAPVRGGPTMANPLSQGQRPQDALADFLEAAGVHPAMSNFYRTDQVNLGSDASEIGAAGYASGQGKGKIALDNFLQRLTEPEVVRVAQHEAAHRYDQNRGLTKDPMYREGIPIVQEQYPEDASYLQAVPPQDPSYFYHTYTAPFDQGLLLNELPPPLRDYFRTESGESLLNMNPLLLAVLRNRLQPMGPSLEDLLLGNVGG